MYCCNGSTGFGNDVSAAVHEIPSILLLLLFCICRNTNDDISENKSGISSTKSTIKKKKKKKKSRKKMAGAQQPKKKPKVPVEELRLGGQVEVEARGKVQFAVVRYIGPTHFLQGNIVHAYKNCHNYYIISNQETWLSARNTCATKHPPTHNIRRDLDWIGTF